MIYVNEHKKISSCIALSIEPKKAGFYNTAFYALVCEVIGGGTYQHCLSTTDAWCSSGAGPWDCGRTASDRPPPRGPGSPPAVAQPSGHLKQAQ